MRISLQEALKTTIRTKKLILTLIIPETHNPWLDSLQQLAIPAGQYKNLRLHFFDILKLPSKHTEIVQINPNSLERELWKSVHPNKCGLKSYKIKKQKQECFH